MGKEKIEVGIKINSAKCLMCGDILRSRSRHEYVICSCGNLAVDGGIDYLKRSARKMKNVEELSIDEDGKKIVIKKKDYGEGWQKDPV